MRRIITTAVTLALFAGSLTMATGCASTGGPYFKQSRDNQPHAQRNRIYNPADYRYVHVENE